MGQSPSKPATRVAVEQLAPATPNNPRPSAAILRSPDDSPVSLTSHLSHRSAISSPTTRSNPHELEGITRTRRYSDAVVSIDESSTAVGSFGLQPLYEQSLHRKSQSPLIYRTQQQRKSRITGDVVFEIQPIHEKLSLRIICPLLSGVLKKASVGSLGTLQIADSSSPMSTIVDPCEWLCHNRKRVRLAAQQVPGKHTPHHVDLLLEFVKEQRPSTWDKLDEVDAGNCRKISFEDIWLIYPPGATVFAKDEGGWRAYKVERIESNSSSSLNEMLIHCLYLDLDGTGQRLIPKREVFTVRSYSSELPIGDLEVIPDWHFPCRNGLSETLIERGKKFWEYSRNVNHKEYCGQAWPRSSRQGPIQIVIDYVTSSKHAEFVQNIQSRIQGSSTCFACLGEARGLPSYPEDAPHDSDVCTRSSESMNRESEDLPEVAQNPLLFCPSRMWAFSLKHKSWELIIPEDIRDVQRHSDALNQLVLKDNDKKYLDSAVHSYLMDESMKQSDGTVRGNGSGLTILLHGGPGTGKTFTAECLAAKYKIPLYKITCADLGTDLDVLEKRLQEICLRAANWKALLLLDEADMFIRARDTQDLRQYAVVSIFLNHLDNSEALLFITSTRVEILDQALESRITMPIQLPDISFEAQKIIWKNLILRLENPSENEKKMWEQFIKVELYTTEAGAYTTMNGRQIKTCITAAMTLARKENENLDVKHIKEMLRLGREFRKLIQENSEDPKSRLKFLQRAVPCQAQRPSP